MRHKGGVLTSWSVSRKYSKSEIASARYFLAKIKKVFEPAGEECGTVYDESAACRICRCGALQLGPLTIDGGRFPKNADVARSIAGEIVVAQAMVDVIERHALKGGHYTPIVFSKRAPERPWYQLQPKPEVDIDPLTHVGRTPFEDGAPEEMCPKGHLLGLNLLSELILSGPAPRGADVVYSRQFIGVRRGLLRPQPALVVSARAREVFDAASVKGLDYEVAHIAPLVDRANDSL
jgi:hypothetical protein